MQQMDLHNDVQVTEEENTDGNIQYFISDDVFAIFPLSERCRHVGREREVDDTTKVFQRVQIWGIVVCGSCLTPRGHHWQSLWFLFNLAHSQKFKFWRQQNSFSVPISPNVQNLSL